MKRLAIVALITAGAILPAYAQHSAGHAGGAAVHSAPASRGGSSAAPRSYAPGPRSSATRYGGPAQRAAGSGPMAYRPMPRSGVATRNGVGRGSAGTMPNGRQLGPNSGDQARSGHHRMPYRPDHRNGYGYYPYGSVGWVSPYVLGYPDTIGDNEDAQGSADNGAQQVNGEQAGGDYGAPPPDQGQQALAPWPGPAAAQSAAVQEPASAQVPEEAVTLVYKDGRPPEQIHNYLLTGTTLYVQDQHRRDIPLSQLDLVATAKANRASGVEFQLPEAAK